MDLLLSREQGIKVIIIDLSELPSDLLSLIIAIISKSIYDFSYWNLERDYPMLLVYEESHRYLSHNSYPYIARRTIEKISKEGRKYGISVAICSQRPSEISDTILAQCNNFITSTIYREGSANSKSPT